MDFESSITNIEEEVVSISFEFDIGPNRQNTGPVEIVFNSSFWAGSYLKFTECLIFDIFTPMKLQTKSASILLAITNKWPRLL